MERLDWFRLSSVWDQIIFQNCFLNLDEEILETGIRLYSVLSYCSKSRKSELSESIMFCVVHYNQH